MRCITSANVACGVHAGDSGRDARYGPAGARASASRSARIRASPDLASISGVARSAAYAARMIEDSGRATRLARCSAIAAEAGNPAAARKAARGALQHGCSRSARR